MDKAVHQAAVEKFGALMPAWQGTPPALFAAIAPLVKGNNYYGPVGEYEFGSMLKKRQASPIPVRQLICRFKKYETSAVVITTVLCFV